MLTKSHKDNSHSAYGKALIVAVLLPVHLEAVVLGSIAVAFIDKILYLSKNSGNISCCLYTLRQLIFALFFTQVKDLVNDCNWNRTQNHLVCKRTLNHLTKLAK